MAFGGASQSLAQRAVNIELFGATGKRSNGGVDAVVPLRQNGTSMLFANPKVYLAEGGASEFNLALAYRGYTANDEWLWGLYGAWDRRRTTESQTFNQATVGIEARSVTWDARANFYIPTTGKQLVGLGETNGFSGFSVFRNGIYVEAMQGLDIETGRLIPLHNRYEIRGYLAGYRFEGKDVAPRTEGGRVRVEVRPRHNVIIGASFQRDRMFGSAGLFELRYAFGKSASAGTRTLDQRMTDPWVRDVNIVVSNPTISPHSDFAVAMPDRVTHIDSAKTPAGTRDGSFESPFADTASCTACTVPGTNLVRLWQGTGAPYSPYSLQSGQMLWGEGYDIFSGRASGVHPLLGTGATAVTLASDSGVAGVKTNGSIYGNNVFGNLSVRGNVIQNTAGNGIHILNNSGNGLADIVVASNIINTPAGRAVFVRNFAGAGSTMRQNLTLTGNTITTQYGVRAENEASINATAQQTLVLSRNTITRANSNTGYGIELINRSHHGTGGIAAQDVAVTNNVISWGTYGLQVNNGAGSGGYANQNVTLSGNTITTAGMFVYSFRSNNSGFDVGTRAVQHLMISGNTVITSSDRFSRMFNVFNYGHYGSSNSQTTTISGNTLLSNPGTQGHKILEFGNRAVSFTTPTSTDSTQTVTVTGNTITPFGPSGTYVFDLRNFSRTYAGPVNAVQSSVLSGNTVSISATNGGTFGAFASSIARNTGASSNQFLTLTGNRMTESTTAWGTGVSAVYATATSQAGGASTQSATLTGNTLQLTASPVNGSAYGVFMQGNSTAQSVTLSGNNVDLSGRYVGTVRSTGAGTCSGLGTPDCP